MHQAIIMILLDIINKYNISQKSSLNLKFKVEIALMEVLTARTSEIPPCRNIRKMIGRKVLKITKRLTNQTQ